MDQRDPALAQGRGAALERIQQPFVQIEARQRVGSLRYSVGQRIFARGPGKPVCRATAQRVGRGAEQFGDVVLAFVLQPGRQGQ